jgi:ribosomal protein S18 acetylase RimI-like enzyme
VGRALTLRCLALAREHGRARVVLHTTTPMKIAWAMYESMGFVRTPALDFEQHGFPISGFALAL